jgi:protein-S-isoprenylcysteine O-methyltransferase Ste14
LSALRIILLNLFLSALTIMVAASAFLIDRYLPFTLPGTLTFIAWPFMLIGGGLIIWAAITLARQSGSTGAPFDPTRRLVSTGPYARMRNPIYAGDILLIFGLAFLTRSLSMLLYTILFALAIDVFVRRVEEPRTERRLGEVYRYYVETVPRWIPRIHFDNHEEGA